MLDKVSMAKAVNSTAINLGKVYMLQQVTIETTVLELSTATAFYIEVDDEDEALAYTE